MSLLNTAVLCAAVAVTPLPAFAQQKPRPDPTDAKAPVSATGYDSIFRSYVPDREVQPAGWREINDEAGQIGGHAGQMRGATGGAGRSVVPVGKPDTKPPAQADTPAAGSHAGHRK
jgi:hypothetical protein